MTFFIDNNLSPVLALGLRGFGEEVRHLREQFPPETPDEVWLPAIAERGWYLISRDKKIAKKPAQRALLTSIGIGAFFFTQRKDPTGWEWVEIIVKRWRGIREGAARNPTPFIVGIPEVGRFHRY